MNAHPLSSYWPEMPPDDFKELVSDIITHGVRDPIVTLDGMILDGRHRFRAATVANADCPTVEYTGDDPAGFVISKNGTRRHITKIERAKAILQCRDWKSPGSAVKNKAAKSNQELATEAGTSIGTVRVAKRQLREERGEVKPTSRNTPNGQNRIDKNAEKEARPLSKQEETELRVAAREARIRDLEDEKADLEERVALMQDGDAGGTNALEAWQGERNVLRKQIAAWQTKFEECRRAGLAKDKEIRALKKQVAEYEKEERKRTDA